MHKLTPIWVSCKLVGLQVWSIWRDGALKTGGFQIGVLMVWPLSELNTCRQQRGAWWIASVFSQLWEQMLKGEPEHVFVSSCTLFFSLLLILYSCGEGTGGWFKRGASRDDTLLTLLALILMPHARGLYTIHFNAISSCQEGWVIQWEHNCILKFLHWFIPGM